MVKTFILLACVANGAGTTEQAQPLLNKFLRRVEEAVGWNAKALTGQYHTERAACEAFRKKARPQLAVVDLATYLSRARRWRLRPLATMGGMAAKRYYLLARQGDSGRIPKLAALRGKKLISPYADDPHFVAYLLFGGKKKGARFFKLEPTGRPLRGLRAVARGQAAATLVDETAYAYLEELKLSAPLVVVHRSPPLPGLTLAAIDHPLPPKTRAALLAALPKLCTGGGQPLCKAAGADRIVPTDLGAYMRLLRPAKGGSGPR